MVPAPRIEILGIPFTPLTADDALVAIERLYERAEPATVFHANVHTVNLAASDPGYMEVLRSGDLVLNDGKGVMLGARLLGSRFPHDLNGNFVTPLVLERAAERGWPTFLLGARPDVIERAADLVAGRYPGLEIVGTHHGYIKDDADVARAIRDAGPGLLLCGMGNPNQESWLARNLRATGARLGIGVGAFFDFQTGEIRRAPAWMNRVGIEWIHRLFKEPARMWRRYIVGNPFFVARVLRQRVRGGRVTS